MLSLFATTSVAQARVCYVSDFDTRGCIKGDELLYLPNNWGNEQLPVEFIAKKCDFSKQIAWTKGGVTCVYSGPKDVVSGADEVKYMSYSALYNRVSKNPNGWVKAENGWFWKLSKKGNGSPMKVGDRVVLTYQSCEHDINGQEHPSGKFVPDGEIESLTKNHYVYMAQAEPTYGSVIEIVAPTQHGYVKVEKKQSQPKSKPQTKSKL